MEADDPPDAPPGSVLARVQDLTLDSLPAPIGTYFSPGAASRAAELQSALRTANAYFRDRLGIEPSFDVAVLDEKAWAALTPGPYGAGWVSDPPWVLVLPAEPDRAVVAQIYAAARSKLPADAEEQLARLGMSFDDAVRRVVDLIAFHEVAHVYVAGFGFRAGETARWLEELLSTYAAYSYLQASEPSAIEVWNALSEAIVNHVQPASRSLDEFNRLYVQGLGPETYGWFQSQFNLRDAVIVELRPEVSWFAQLRAAGLTANTRDLLTSDLLAQLDATVPGFTQWAERVGFEYR